jgi:hypothetical protein
MADSDQDELDLDFNTSRGGSSGLRLKRNRKPAASHAEKVARAAERALAKLGQEKYDEIKQSWAALLNPNNQNGDDWEKGNGIIINLLSLNFSHLEIRTMLGCGGSRISRLADYMKDPQPKVRKTPAHAFNDDDDKKRIHAHINSYEREDGFPCSHRRPRQYFVTEKLTWTSIHKDYEAKMKQQGQRVASFSRFFQFVKFLFPGLRLARSQEDVCL